MFITQAPRPQKHHHRQDHGNGEIHDKACNREADFAMEACMEETSAMGACQMHRVRNMFPKDERDHPPNEQTTQDPNIHMLSREKFDGNERHKCAKENLHIFLIFFHVQTTANTRITKWSSRTI
jgi:hypothetical protein